MAESRGITPSWIDRKILVWYKKFPDPSAIPSIVPGKTIEACRQKFRIHASMGIMVLAAAGMLWGAIQGKQALHRGETVSYMSRQTHKEYGSVRPEDKVK